MLKANTNRPIQLITIFNLLGFIALWLFYNRDFEILLYGTFIVGMMWVAYAFLCSMTVDDRYIFLIVLLLFSVGNIMIFRCDRASGERQMLWLGLGLVAFFFSYFIVMRTKWISSIGYGFFFAAVGLSVFTMIFGSDITGTGVKNWLVFGSVSIQTTEIVKYLILFILADRFHNPKRYRLFGLPEGVVVSAAVYFILALMVLQKEMGTILVIFTTYIALLYLFNEKRWIIWANVGLIALGGLLLFLLKDSLLSDVYNTLMGRVEIWDNLWKISPYDTKYIGAGEMMQSMFAIGSGGFFGTGIGLGTPGAISYIGAEKSDYIFASVCEEMGIMTGVVIIFLFFLLMYRGLRLSLNIKHKFYRSIGAGICIMFGFQTFIIIGGVTKLIPMTGITLPFVSYGGSSLIVGFMAIGFLEGAANKTDETLKAMAAKKNGLKVSGTGFIGDTRFIRSIYNHEEDEQVQDLILPDQTEVNLKEQSGKPADAMQFVQTEIAENNQPQSATSEQSDGETFFQTGGDL